MVDDHGVSHADDPAQSPDPGASTQERAHRRGRKGLAAGLALGLLGGTAAGLVFGVPALTSASPSDRVAQVEPTDTTEPAADEAPSTDALIDEFESHSTDALREELQALVDDGTITAAQADAVADHLVGSVFDRAESWLAEHGIDLSDLKLGDWTLGDFNLDDVDLGDFDLGDVQQRLGELRERFESGDFGTFGHGRGSGEWAGGGVFGRGAGVVSEALTDLLGLDVHELRQQLRDGATLAEIATAQGVEPQAVVDELVAEYRERLDSAVENGRLEQADADARLAKATERITQLVEG